VWGKFQPGDEKRLDAVFLDAGDRVVVLFRLKGLAAESGRAIDVPVVAHTGYAAAEWWSHSCFTQTQPRLSK
jgi:hypothetical protein